MSGYARLTSIAMVIVYSLPLVGFCVVLLSKVVDKVPLLERAKLDFLHALTQNGATIHKQTDDGHDIEANIELPDRILHTEAYLDTY